MLPFYTKEPFADWECSYLCFTCTNDGSPVVQNFGRDATVKNDAAMRNNVLLVVHDHQDPDLYKKLQRGYNVFVAYNWEKALQVLEKNAIQLIISSLEFCVQCKSSSCFDYIPVIVLAGDNSHQSKLKSLEAGADAFIGNPVPWMYLDAQIRNLIINRVKISNHLALTRLGENDSPEVIGEDDFLKKLNDLIFENLHDRLLNADRLAGFMNMSRPTLYRKIKAVTDNTLNELINLARLKQAAERLESGDYKVFEIARMAGFQSQSSFGKAFIKQFKVTPTQYLQMKKKNPIGTEAAIRKNPGYNMERMNVLKRIFLLALLFITGNCLAQNPIIFADVPDMSMVRVGDTYYMSSTTMHMSPGVPIMQSKDLVNWKLVNYAYDTLANVDALDLEHGKSAYGKGSWASCIRYHNGLYYVSTFAQTTNKTYIYSTKDIERGPWKASSFSPSLHDHSLFFDDDGRVYMITGSGRLRLVELNADLSGVKPGAEQVIIENASAPSGNNIGLPAEGSQLFKINGKYYLFNITWPKGGMRTVVVHRADKITGPYEGRLALQDLGVAQGGLISTPENNWYAYLFRDYGAVGRIPYLVPVKWVDGWPVLGVDGKVPETLDLPAGKGLIPGIVASDEFTRQKGERALPLVWQWNHNPDNALWSVTKRKGYLRLTTGRIDTSFLLARNTLTQRTIGPECTGSTLIDVSNMKEGDLAGLCVLQKRYGLVGVQCTNGGKSIVMISAESEKPVELQRIPLNQNKVYCKIECNFRNKKDLATFYYSLDGKTWDRIGAPLQMAYTIPQFMGYRFGLFNYATQQAGGYVDFDFFHIEDRITGQ